jgi:hypothetical protein
MGVTKQALLFPFWELSHFSRRRAPDERRVRIGAFVLLRFGDRIFS